ncbi:MULTISPECIES: hypothetical protein [Vibrio harveyi group]|uniref:hypothetical protein n=1 Tax=Vibrio harveyi group TaxID=717610 RepID=UPI00069BC485|nr:MULTISPECIES: hypothetical protein [Vibrio harveyi group]AUV88265.1 hypothetical protein C1N50_19075 [Vibrio campbellii]
MHKLNKILENRANTQNVTGTWYAIQWQPDIATKETLNIGVGVKTSDGGVYVQMLDLFERVECMYSKDMIFHAELACNVSREVIMSQGFKEQIAPQIRCDKRGFTQGESSVQILNRLYDSVVSLGKIRAQKSQKSQSFSTINRDALYNGMQEKLRLDLELNYSFHVPKDPFQVLNHDGRQHKLYLPFRKNKGSATLISAAYKDVQRVKSNLFDGSRDVQIAKDELSHTENAIFLMLPGDGLETDKLIAIENDIDKFTWLMSKQRVKIECESSEDILADRITEWCTAA